MEAMGVDQTKTATSAAGETLPYRNAVEMFTERVRASRLRPVFRTKVGSEWRSSTWGDWDQAAREVAGGLIALGLGVGERGCLLGDTCPDWLHSEIGLLMAGGVTVPIYQSNLPHECEYIINDCGARVVFAQNAKQLEKLVSVRAQLANVVRVVTFEPVAGADADWVTSLSDLRAAGQKWIAEHADELERRWVEVKASDTFTIVYTSGTTGNPKGVVLAHESIVFTAYSIREVLTFSEQDEQLLFLPLAHIFARVLEWATIYKGAQIAFAESIAQLVPNLGEVKPSFMGAVPRVYEKVYAKIQANRAASSPTKRKIFDWAVGVGRQVSARQQAGQPIPAGLAFRHAIANKLVFSKIQAVLGGRIRFLISGGAPLAREIAEFFHAVGLLVLEGYGLTETTGASFINREHKFRFGTVGMPIPGLEVKIADDGEILLRGKSVLKEYHGKPEATAEVLEPDGWFHTGDIGEFEDGFLRITDRKKDLIVTAGGKKVPPQNLENLLKTTPYISQVMVHGDKRPYLTALVTLNEEAIRRWAGENHIAAQDLAELAQHAEVRKLIQQAFDQLNAQQPSYATVKKFNILPTDFTQETGELTPTLKVKRKFVTDRHLALLDSFYAN